MGSHELVAADHRETLAFFAASLHDICESSVSRQELIYNASVLAHYAQVSTCTGTDVPAPASLHIVFDQFVFDSSMQRDSSMMEVAGAQCLLMAGFFEDQMRHRHNIRWYSQLGTSFFTRAASCERSSGKAQLLTTIARAFEPWRQRHARLSRTLRDRQYLLTVPAPPKA